MGVLISIIIPTYNRVKELSFALDSIESQEFQNYEVVIVDDASEEDIESVVDKYPQMSIQYIRNAHNLGAGKSREIGYKRAQGEVVIFFDDDDRLTDNSYFTKICHIFENNSSCIAVCAESKSVFADRQRTVQSRLNLPEFISSRVYLNGFMTVYDKPLSTFTFAIRLPRNALLREGVIFNDTSIYLNVLLFEGDIYHLSDIIGEYICHKNNMSTAVKAHFILDNLMSKKCIQEIGRRQGCIDFPDMWLYEQTMHSISYFLSAVNQTVESQNTLVTWVFSNLSPKYSIKLAMRMIVMNVQRKNIKRGIQDKHREI